MTDLTVNVKSFEDFLAEEDTKSLAEKGHHIKNGDQTADKVEGDGIKDGSDADDVIEKSYKAAPGDDKGEKLKDPS